MHKEEFPSNDNKFSEKLIIYTGFKKIPNNAKSIEQPVVVQDGCRQNKQINSTLNRIYCSKFISKSKI